jgi:gp64
MAHTGFKRPGRYAALAAAYYDDPAIIAVGPDAELWYVRALAWCAAHPETDGVIPLEVAVNRLGIPDAMSRVITCDSHGLVTKNDDSVSVTSWVKWNDSWRDIQERTESKRAFARARKARERARKSDPTKTDNVTRDNVRDMGRDNPRDSRDKEKGVRSKENITTPPTGTPHAEGVTETAAELVTVAADAAPATANASKPSKARGTRLPDGWQPDQALADWTRANAPAAANGLEVERFRDYWAAQPGAKGRKADWAATWRNWARRCQEQAHGPHRAPSPRATTDERVNGWLALAESLDPNHQPTSQPSLIAIEGGAA